MCRNVCFKLAPFLFKLIKFRIFFGNLFIYKNLQKCVTEKRTYVNKVCNLSNCYVLTVFLSIPFNKLPWISAWKIFYFCGPKIEVKECLIMESEKMGLYMKIKIVWNIPNNLSKKTYNCIWSCLREIYYPAIS